MNKALDVSIDDAAKVDSSHSHTWAIIRVILPYFAVPAVAVAAYHWGIAWYDIGLFLVLVFLSGVGFSVGMHRFFTHHSFKTNSLVKTALGIFGLSGSHINIKEYVAAHRCHHAFPDQPEDPHSPHYATPEGSKNTLVGLLHAHTGWGFSKRLNMPEKIQKYASDYHDDDLVNFLDRHHVAIFIGSLLLPAALGALAAWHWQGAITGFLWGGLLRLFVADQVENWGRGISHVFGYQPLRAKGHSTNHWIAVISMGEWHNNHHAFPNSARQGLEWWQIDVGYYVILILEKLGLAWDVVRVDRARIEAKRVANS